jgi:hypothetical protein
MAISAGSKVQIARKDNWKTWGWTNQSGQIVKCLLWPDRIYTVTVAAGRFKQKDGTYQLCTKMTDPNTGLEVMCERDAIVEAVPAT